MIQNLPRSFCKQNRRCRKPSHCGRARPGHERRCKKERFICPKTRYNGFFEMLEGNMEIDMESMSDLDYGSTGYRISSSGT